MRSSLCETSQRLICFVDVPPLLTIHIVISFRPRQDEFPAFVMVIVTSERNGIGIF